MATGTVGIQTLLFNRAGNLLADINPTIRNISWRLNEWGISEFHLPFADAACTPSNLRYGNFVLHRFESGLTSFGGLIDSPRSVDGEGVNVTAYSAEKIFEWRDTPLEIVFTGIAPGSIYAGLIEAMNQESTTGIELGDRNRWCAHITHVSSTKHLEADNYSSG